MNRKKNIYVLYKITIFQKDLKSMDQANNYLYFVTCLSLKVYDMKDVAMQNESTNINIEIYLYEDNTLPLHVR